MMEARSTLQNIEVTSASVLVDTIPNINDLRQSNIAVKIEERDTIMRYRMSNIAVMVEYTDILGDCGIGDNGLATYRKFARGKHCYLSRAGEAGLNITGTLTIGCWVWFNAKSRGVDVGLISKWYHVTDERGYLLYKNSAGEFVFSVSQDGTNVLNSISDLGVSFASDGWYYIVGRFTPSGEIAIFVNGTWYKDTAGVFPSIHDSTEAFEIGRYGRDNYLDGFVCHIFVSSEAISDTDVEAYYSHTKAMFPHHKEYDEGSHPGSGIRATNAAVMLEYRRQGLRMTNASVMIERQENDYLRLTNGSIMIEYAPPVMERMTDAAVEIEYATTNTLRVTNAGVMIEYSPASRLKVSNAAVMIEYEAT